MKKQLKEKQLKKRMVTVKKGVVVAATALILSNSPMAVVTALAESQIDGEIQTKVEQENKNMEVKAMIDESRYGNRVQDLDFIVNNNQFEKWNLGYDDSASSDYSLSVIEGGSYNANFSNNNYNNRLKINNTKDLLQFMYKGFKVGNNYAVFQLQQKLATFARRTYTVTASLTSPQKGTSLQVELDYIKSEKTKEGESKVTLYKHVDKANPNFRINIYNESSDTEKNISLDKTSINVELTYANEWKRVDALFTSLDKTQLAEDVTIKDIQNVKSLVESIPDVPGIPNVPDVEYMKEAINKANVLFEKKAADSVASLLNNGQLSSGVSQEQIDKAQDLVNQLPDGEKKQELQSQLDKAKEQFKQQQ